MEEENLVLMTITNRLFVKATGGWQEQESPISVNQFSSVSGG
jgi:hypothetical protein